MKDLNITMAMMCIIGSLIFIAGMLYGKKTHDKIASSDILYYSNDSLLWTPVFLLLNVFFGFGPWWLTKIFWLILGLIILASGLPTFLE